MNYTEELSLAINAAKEAGKIALKYYKTELDVERKLEAGNSPLTVADTEIDEYLKNTLIGATPDYGWLSEETVDDKTRLNKELVWIVDPIDGTKDFITGTDCFAISIGLSFKGKPVLGVIYNPAKNEMIAGCKGGGVTFNNEKVTINIPHFNNATCFTSSTEARRGLWNNFAELNTIPLGSVAYKLALVAAGKGTMTASLYPKNEWDVAAGFFLCEEQGCKVSDLSGQNVLFNQENTLLNGIIAAPTSLFDKLEAMLPNRVAGGYK